MEAPELERRLAAIMAADVEGYSRLMHGDEEGTMAALSMRRAVIDELIVGTRGRIANTAGDSVLAEFASILDAVTCAVEIQRELTHINEQPEEISMRFRIGINVGDVMVKDGDIFGDGVNVAARLESLADGGGICVSRGVRDHLRHRTNLVFEDLGEQLVKNISHPVRAFRLRLVDSEDNFMLGSAPADDTVFVDDAVPSSDQQTALELAFWESVKDGGAEELAAYLEKFPDGTFAGLARARQSGGEAKELEPPSERAAALPDAVELAFWDAIKDSQQHDELAAYLERYSEGHFAPLARARLARADEPDDQGERGPASVGDAIELAFWESIKDTADLDLYQAYLDKYPGGEFVVIAKARLAHAADAP
jgi:class 3 adenylate cyclase